MSIVVLQNVVAYSVNMADNIMLGSYSQSALSGAATVNQVQFMTQQITLAIGDSLVVLGSQFWGEKRTEPIRKLTGIALIFGFVLGFGVFAWTSLDPAGVLAIFTDDEGYIAEGVKYLELIRFTYPIYVITTVLLSALRSVKTVGIALWVSASSLLLDVGINYVLIFGKFGMPEMGIKGAAVGTLVARAMELVTVLVYLVFIDKKLRLFTQNIFAFTKELFAKFFRILLPSFISNFVWSIATPIQTAILGHLSKDAIAANSVSVTMFQYLKIIVIGEASASAVVIGNTIGETKGDGNGNEKVKEYSRTLQLMYILFALALGTLLFFLRGPYLSLYDLSPTAMEMADEILILMCFIFVGMAYQMPTSVGIIKGGGDVKYVMFLNLVSTWGIVMPLSFAAAFVWNLPIVWIVALLNSDQIFKCIPIAIHTARNKWIKRLT